MAQDRILFRTAVLGGLFQCENAKLHERFDDWQADVAQHHFSWVGGTQFLRKRATPLSTRAVANLQLYVFGFAWTCWPPLPPQSRIATMQPPRTLRAQSNPIAGGV